MECIIIKTAEIFLISYLHFYLHQNFAGEVYIM